MAKTLTNWLREEIKDSIVNFALKERKEQLRLKKQKLDLEVYDFCVPEPVKVALNKVPNEFLKLESTINVMFQDAEGSRQGTTQLWLEDEAPTTVIRSYHTAFAIHNPRLQQSCEELEKEQTKLEQLEDELRRETAAILGQARTKKALLKLWLELPELMPTADFNRLLEEVDCNLPAVQTEALVGKLLCLRNTTEPCN